MVGSSFPVSQFWRIELPFPMGVRSDTPVAGTHHKSHHEPSVSFRIISSAEVVIFFFHEVGRSRPAGEVSSPCCLCSHATGRHLRISLVPVIHDFHIKRRFLRLPPPVMRPRLPSKGRVPLRSWCPSYSKVCSFFWFPVPVPVERAMVGRPSLLFFFLLSCPFVASEMTICTSVRQSSPYDQFSRAFCPLRPLLGTAFFLPHTASRNRLSLTRFFFFFPPSHFPPQPFAFLFSCCRPKLKRFSAVFWL